MEEKLSFKDKLKLFQKEANKMPFLEKNNPKKNSFKIGEFGKRNFISEEIEDDKIPKAATIHELKETKNKRKKAIGEEIINFIKEKPVFPCLLISKDDNGKIEMNMNCLKDIDLDNIKIIKEEGFEMTKRKDMYDYQVIDFSNFQFDISVLHNNINYEFKTKNLEKISEKNSLIIGKYKLYSFNINEGDLSFNSHFLNKFETIANDDSSDKIKAKEIDEIFESQGYFIPLKIYIGGLFINRYNKKNSKSLRESIVRLNKTLAENEFKLKDGFESSSENDLNKIFINQNTQIIGGDKNEKNFDKWTKSVRITNSHIIECTNIIEAKNILPNELKQKLKIPLQLVETKYLKRRKYYQIINALKDIQLDEYKGYDDLSKGLCKERKIPEIYKKVIDFYADKSVGYTTKAVSESFEDIIVGFKFISKRDDDKNGEWDIKFNPLLKKEIYVTFTSQFIRVEKYLIEIYLMKFPE